MGEIYENMCIKIFSEKTAKILSWMGLALIILGAFIFILCRSWDFSWTISEEKVGQFGDFVGGVVGCIFAFVGVILYYVALTDQREDIRINREALETQVKTLNQQIEEFKAQTKEMQETRTVYEEQTKLYRKQTEYYEQQVKELKNQTKISSLQHFNSEFYSLLNVFISIKKNCEKTISDLLCKLKSIPVSNNDTICNKHSVLIEEYTKQYYNNSSSLSIFFKTIYRLLKMIDDSNIESESKQRYAKTLRSQLSEQELLILYYDYCSVLGEKVRLLAIKYNLLKHLNLTRKFELDYSKFENNKIPILTYLQELSVILNSKIKQSQDLENEEDIIVNGELYFINTKSNYNLEINDKFFIFGIEIPKEQQLYNKDDFTSLFLMFLYEYFFLSKLKKPIEQIFEKQIIERDKSFEYKYQSEINSII